MSIESGKRAAAVFTYKSIARIAQDGGTQSWRMDAKHIGTFDWAICARCRTQTSAPAEDDRPHKSAFLIGKVTDVVPSTEGNDAEGRGEHRRWLFRMSEVAIINDKPDFWQFGRWPTSIDTLESFGINPANYVFRPIGDLVDDAVEASVVREDAARRADLAARAHRSVSEIIADHKTSLSHEIGVPEDRIDISIRF